MPGMIKLGILSFAHMHAYSYAASVNALPGVELSAVWDDGPKRGRAAAKQFGAPYEGNLDRLLQSDIDGVIITAENAKHRNLAEAAAKAGKWVLCEKPLATTVKDAKAIVKACEKAGVGLGTAFPCRFVSALIEARTQLQAGAFGDILAVSCTNHGQFPGGWFADNTLAGGGAIMDHTVHVADALRWMLGKEFTGVYCEGGNQLHGDAIDTDDLGSLHLEMEEGVQVSHVASWSRPETFPTWGDVTMEFVGSGGVLQVDAFLQKVSVFNDEAKRHDWAFWGDNPDLGLVQDFADAIRDQRPLCATGEDGLRAVEVTAAAYRAMKAKRMVAV